MFDLDGVVYIGEDAVPGAPEHLARARERGVHLAFITNNASRPPEAVVEKLAGIGVQATVGDVVTSAQAAARVLSEQHGAGRPDRGPRRGRPRGGVARRGAGAGGRRPTSVRWRW